MTDHSSITMNSLIMVMEGRKWGEKEESWGERGGGVVRGEAVCLISRIIALGVCANTVNSSHGGILLDKCQRMKRGGRNMKKA